LFNQLKKVLNEENNLKKNNRPLGSDHNILMYSQSPGMPPSILNPLNQPIPLPLPTTATPTAATSLIPISSGVSTTPSTTPNSSTSSIIPPPIMTPNNNSSSKPQSPFHTPSHPHMAHNPNNCKFLMFL